MSAQRLDRRGLLIAAGAALVAACGTGSRPSSVIGLATGPDGGVYRHLGEALASVWGGDVGADTRILSSDGSVQNIELLHSGTAVGAFCAADVAADAVAGTSAPPGHGLGAMARVHDDAVHVVVLADSPVVRLADLRGRRVSVGAPSSGVRVIAPRLLSTAGLDPARDLSAVELGLDESVPALARGDIDAFLWSGGVPTAAIDDLATTRPIRLVDLTREVSTLRAVHGVYDVTTVPARTYGLTEPVTVPSVRNVLLVAADLPDELVEDLTRSLLDHRDVLAAADPAGRAIDQRTAIITEPVRLHPGAAAAYRALKGI